MFLLLLSIFGSLAVFLPNRHFLLDVNTALAEYYLAGHVLSLLLLVLCRKRLASRIFFSSVLILLSLSALHLRVLLPFYLPSVDEEPRLSEGQLELSVFVSNVNLSNRARAADLLAVIAANNPDVVGLLEVDNNWLTTLGLDQKYPYSITQPRIDNFGLALYSRFPLAEPRTFAGWELPPVILTALDTPTSGRIHLGLIHAKPPIGQNAFYLNYLLSRRLSSHYRHETERAILMGDFNSTPFGRVYDVLVKGAYFSNAAHGYGLARTWNARLPLVNLSLDHVLYKGSLGVKSFKKLPDVGSDHYPLLVNFLIHADSAFTPKKNSP